MAVERPESAPVERAAWLARICGTRAYQNTRFDALYAASTALAGTAPGAGGDAARMRLA